MANIIKFYYVYIYISGVFTQTHIDKWFFRFFFWFLTFKYNDYNIIYHYNTSCYTLALYKNSIKIIPVIFTQLIIVLH